MNPSEKDCGRRAFQMSRRYLISNTEKVMNLKKAAVANALKTVSSFVRTIDNQWH